jgi:hypothetical protein
MTDPIYSRPSYPDWGVNEFAPDRLPAGDVVIIEHRPAALTVQEKPRGAVGWIFALWAASIAAGVLIGFAI